MILFATHLAKRIKPQSIQVYLAAIRSLHVANGYPNPLQPGLKLKQTLRGIERKHFKPPKQKLPLTFDILCEIRPFINYASFNDLAYWTAMTTAHFLMLRASEFTLRKGELFDPTIHLTAADVQFHTSPQGKEYLSFRIKKSKTDQRKQGITLYTAHTGHKVCAVCAMKTYLSLRSPKTNISLFHLANHSPVSREELLAFISHLLILIGINPSQYSGHSFRIGGATSASLAGLTDYEIKLLGRWNSDCYKRYIRSPLNLFLEIPAKLANTETIKYQYANPYVLDS